MPVRPPRPDLPRTAGTPVGERAGMTRRDWIAGIGATALLTACGTPESTAEQSADASDLDADAGTVGGATDAAADLTGDVTATDLGTAATTDVAGEVATSGPSMDPITPNERFYITSCCSTPAVDAGAWTLTISDRGKLLATLDMAFLESLKPRDKEHTLECIGGGPQYQLISNAIWTGLPLPEILAAKGIQVPSDVSEMKITALDNFSTGLPTSALTLPMWLVWRVNGVPLPPAHGFPARLLVPNRYGMKNPKWVQAIEFVEQPYIGFWETQGWSKTAYYRPNAYIHGMTPLGAPTSKNLRVFGTAFAGRDAIVMVDFRVDKGPWQPVVLDYKGVEDVWTLWHFDWQATSGAHTIQARCTTASGATSDENPEGTDALAGYNGSMAISLTLA